MASAEYNKKGNIIFFANDGLTYVIKENPLFKSDEETPDIDELIVEERFQKKTEQKSEKDKNAEKTIEKKRTGLFGK